MAGVPSTFLEQTLDQVLCRHCLTGTRLFLACSGGRDSLSLAFACVQLYKNGKLSHLPTLIHIHHGLQACADDWVKQVMDFANFYHFSIIIKKLQLDDVSEAGARVGRYRAFFECMNDGDTLLLAHHQDDQAETVLMRLINGTGLTGLTAMQELSYKSQDDKTIALVRPFLSISRQAISDYAKLHSLPYVDDPTNVAGNTANARAFIRTQLKDALHHLNPKAYANIARTARVLGDDRAVLDCHIKAEFDHRLNLSLSPVCVVFELDNFDKLLPSLQIALVRQFAKFALTDSPNHRLSTDLHALATRTDPDHQSELFWQTKSGAFVFYRYKTKLYRYRADFWQALQSEIRLVQDGQTGKFVWDGGALAVEFLMPAQLQKLDKNTKIQIKNNALYGKKLYQTLQIPAPHRQNLWHIKADGCECVMGVGEVWGLGEPQRVVQFGIR